MVTDQSNKIKTKESLSSSLLVVISYNLVPNIIDNYNKLQLKLPIVKPFIYNAIQYLNYGFIFNWLQLSSWSFEPTLYCSSLGLYKKHFSSPPRNLSPIPQSDMCLKLDPIYMIFYTLGTFGLYLWCKFERISYSTHGRRVKLLQVYYPNILRTVILPLFFFFTLIELLIMYSLKEVAWVRKFPAKWGWCYRFLFYGFIDVAFSLRFTLSMKKFFVRSLYFLKEPFHFFNRSLLSFNFTLRLPTSLVDSIPILF